MAGTRAQACARSGGLLVQAVVVVAVVVLNLLQQPGLVTFDTKLDLQFDPLGLMRRSLWMWNPQAAVGELQNQASGYLFPLGPVFLLGTVLPAPGWVWQRLWTAVVMLVAYDGARRLTARWTGVGPLAATLAGLAYALAPRVVTTVGGLSGETLPSAVLPWTVLPLVRYLDGSMRRRTALLASAATLPFMGGHNATEVVAPLALPALVLLMAALPWRRRLADLAAWGLLVVAVCLWWLVPLFLLGRYSPPFLDYIESARNTTSSIGWLAAFRGTDHWVAFLAQGSSAGWQAGWELVSSPGLVLVTSAVAVIGVLGVSLLRAPLRRLMMVSLILGLTVLTLGSGGWDASPLREAWLTLLDGPLAPFRNVHKFDPLVRLPLSIGVGAATGALLQAGSRVAAGPVRPAVARGTAALIALVVVAAGAPALAGRLRPTDGFADLPGPWRAAAAYLDGRPGPVRVLVLPAAGFGIQTWGRTIDTPLQVLTKQPWVMRNQSPLVPPETTQLLDALEVLVTSGRPADGLAEVLARMRITHVVVRHDLDPDETDAPSASTVHDVLVDAQGLSLARSFGGAKGRPLVEVFQTDLTVQEPRAWLLPYGERATVQGGAASVVPLVEAGLLPPGRGLFPDDVPNAPTAYVTDVERRVERNFGRVHDAFSDVMTRGAPFRVPRAAHDYADPVGLSVARYTGIVDVQASSSTGYADTAGPVLPEESPWAALDGSALTAWTSSPLTSAAGQWLEVRFAVPTAPGPLTLEFDVTRGSPVRGVRVETGGRSVTASVGPGGAVRGLPLPSMPTRRLRVTVTAVGGDGDGQVRLSTLAVEGVRPERSLVVPGPVGRDTTVLLTSDPGHRACRLATGGVACDVARVSTEQLGFSRVLTVVDPGPRVLTGRVVATNGAQLAALFEPLSSRPVTVRASSFLGGDPAVVPQNAFDGDPGTLWVSAPGDPQPVLDLEWREPRLVTRIRPSLVPGSPGRLPSVLEVTSDEGTQTVRVGGDELALMEPVRTRRLRIALGRSPSATRGERPFAVSELGVEGLEGLTYKASLTASTGSVCGLGPTVTAGGRTSRTRVVGTIGDVLSGETLRVEPCDPGPDLPSGAVPVTVRNPPGFAVTQLVLRPGVAPALTAFSGSQASGPASGVSELEVRRWDASSRVLQVRTGEPSVLVVPQSVNAGWTARLDGRELGPVPADGWMQGWLLPAGSRGTVSLEYAPQAGYVVGLVGGLVVAALVVLLAGWHLFRPARDRREALSWPARQGEAALPQAVRVTALAIASAAVALVSWPFALGAVTGAVLLRRVERSAVRLLFATTTGIAAVWAAAAVDESVVAPTGVDVLVALAAGTLMGRELLVPSRWDEELQG